MSHKEDNGIHFKKKVKTKNKVLRIAAADYTFITCCELTLDEQTVAGLCDVKAKKIYVNTSTPQDDIETLIHEMLHASVYEYGLYQHESWCPRLEEIVAEVVSKFVSANFRTCLKT